MASGERAHREFDEAATSGAITFSALPEWTRVHGKVAWRVLRGPYSKLPEAWRNFPAEVARNARGTPSGPAGDVYLCPPGEHEEDRILTRLYVAF